MSFLRRRLSWILAGWLCVQFAGIVAPVALAAAGLTPADALCECPGTEHGATCPMHHDQASKPDSENRCRLQNSGPHGDATLLSLTGSVGVLPQTATPHIHIVETPVPATGSVLISRTELPDAPPPRS